MDEQSFHPLDYTAVVRRRKWWLIVPVIVCVTAGVLLAMFLPKEYLSQATIGVAAPTLSAELLRGVSSLDKEERQRAISQQLLSSTVLQRVVREEKIDPDKPVDETASWLRANVSQNISVPLPIGSTSPPIRRRDSTVSFSATPTATLNERNASPIVWRTSSPRKTRSSSSNGRRTRPRFSASRCRRARRALPGSRVSFARRSRPTWAGFPTR